MARRKIGGFGGVTTHYGNQVAVIGFLQGGAAFDFADIAAANDAPTDGSRHEGNYFWRKR
jgi:hypothetical protein